MISLLREAMDSEVLRPNSLGRFEEIGQVV